MGQSTRRKPAKGKVFFPFRYRQELSFAPAEFIRYLDNSIAMYRATTLKGGLIADDI